jgi:hypothetical protein
MESMAVVVVVVYGKVGSQYSLDLAATLGEELVPLHRQVEEPEVDSALKRLLD